MKKFQLAVILLFISVHINANILCPEDSIGVTKLDGKLHIKYLVMPGETIYGLSTRFGVQISDLMDINPELINGLKVGQQILIPYNPEIAQKNKKEESGNVVYHEVQPGETLYGLSRKYNVPVNELMKYNNMDLKAGQKIIVGYKDSESKPEVIARNNQVTGEDTKKEKTVKSEVKKEEVKKETSNEKEVKNNKQTAPVEMLKVDEKPEKKIEDTPVPAFSSEQYPFDPDRKQVLVIPFDPYLYFSDADAEIAARSNIPTTKVRQVIRNRLNALLRAPGYETIHLLGGKAKDSLSDINKIYSSVSYNYQEVLYNPNYKEPESSDNNVKKDGRNWFEKQKDKISQGSIASGKAIQTKDNGRYFGVVIKNPEFFNYFGYKYDVDYYIFINQFEVKTNYENCLDRATQNYERIFTTHFSIFDKNGKQIAGNKFNTYYHSNSNYVYQIAADNMEKIANRILAELPAPSKEIE